MEVNKIIQGDSLEILKILPSESIDCIITSPPYWGLRDYGVKGQLGLEKTPEEYVAKMVEVFREVRRVLKKEGTCWLNLGDSYSNLNRKTQKQQGIGDKRGRVTGDPYGQLVTGGRKTTRDSSLSLKEKDKSHLQERRAPQR